MRSSARALSHSSARRPSHHSDQVTVKMRWARGRYVSEFSSATSSGQRDMPRQQRNWNSVRNRRQQSPHHSSTRSAASNSPHQPPRSTRVRHVVHLTLGHEYVRHPTSQHTSHSSDPHRALTRTWHPQQGETRPRGEGVDDGDCFADGVWPCGGEGNDPCGHKVFCPVRLSLWMRTSTQTLANKWAPFSGSERAPADPTACLRGVAVKELVAAQKIKHSSRGNGRRRV